MKNEGDMLDKTREEIDVPERFQYLKTWPPGPAYDELTLKMRPESRLRIDELFFEIFYKYKERGGTPVRPALCLHGSDSLVLCMFNLPMKTHRVLMSRFEIDKQPVTQTIKVLSEDGIVESGPINHYILTLTGSVRKLRPWSMRLVDSKNLVLPVDEIREGRLALSVRMNVDGESYTEACPLLVRHGPRESIWD